MPCSHDRSLRNVLLRPDAYCPAEEHCLRRRGPSHHWSRRIGPLAHRQEFRSLRDFLEAVSSVLCEAMIIVFEGFLFEEETMHRLVGENIVRRDQCARTASSVHDGQRWHGLPKQAVPELCWRCALVRSASSWAAEAAGLELRRRLGISALVIPKSMLSMKTTQRNDHETIQKTLKTMRE